MVFGLIDFVIIVKKNIMVIGIVEQFIYYMKDRSKKRDREVYKIKYSL